MKTTDQTRPNNDLPTQTAAEAPDQRVGIFISMFPERHETFILRELVALEKRGVDFTIYSLQRPRDNLTSEEVVRLQTQRTEYSSLLNLATLLATLATLVSHPLRLVGAIARVLWFGRDRPLEMLKSLAILPMTLYFGQLARRNGISHVHGHWANVPTTACWYLSRIYGFTWSAAIHGEDIFTPNRFLAHKLDDARFTVVCSGLFCNHIQHNIGKARADNVHLNYHGLDPRVMNLAGSSTLTPLADDEPVRLITIGRLVPTKGHDLLIRAMAALVRTHKLNVRLSIIGEGPEMDELKALARSQRVESHIDFVGALQFEEVLQMLQQAHVFVLAPRMIPGQPPDGIPNVIAEAMALHLPVVTTRVSAIPELVEHEESGLLAAENDLDGLIQALVRMLEDASLRQRLAENAYQKVSVMFDQNRNIDELLGYFQQYLPEQAA